MPGNASNPKLREKKLLPPPPPPVPKDPALEHIDAMAMKPFQAYRNQDHRAHITAHMNFMATNSLP